MDADSLTPMLRQYLEIKQKFPGTLLFFRLGDFYELFDQDAIIGARELEITLTARQKDSSRPIPMCGVPHHAASGYISKLVRKGFRVAICEQTEDASKTKKLVRREVVKIITPGTAIDSQLLESRESVFLAAVCAQGEKCGAAFLEISTGEFLVSHFSGENSWQKLCGEIEAFAPKEILFPESLRILAESTFSGNPNRANLLSEEISQIPTSFTTSLTALEDLRFDAETCAELLKRQFAVRELTAFDLQQKSEATRAAGACLSYAHETQRCDVNHIRDIKLLEENEFMILDSLTLANLDVVESRAENSNRSLIGVIDETVTGMGARMLRNWVVRPLIKRTEIQTRLDAVGNLSDSFQREKIRFLLKEVSDIERLVGRLNLGTISPRDFLALNRSLEQTPRINEQLADAKSLLLQVLAENIFELPAIRDLISRAIADEPPINIADGGVIREGFSEELDEFRNISRNAKQIIASFEEAERMRTGISNLRVKFNNVFGYFIEISKGNAARAPEDYERRQTLTNAERYTTPQLKEWEVKVLGAEEQILALEQKLFAGLRSEVSKETSKLQSTARALATLDAIQSLSETASRRNYVAPILHDGDEIEIKNGRHPIVEAFLRENFIPNDIYLNNSTDRLLVITGPNMGGKSTVLRQTALTQILAQIGSFVPASSAKLPIVDRIWTRVGASDDLASGRSTFMVEMTETAQILHNATPRSLILLDEIGRGTSTFDGLSIAWAVAEYLHDSPQNSAKTLFATHYHELTELAEKLPGAKNYQITATEKNGDVVFLHKLERGKASKSYGIAVAKLAGLPHQVIERARDVLSKLEQYELAVFQEEAKSRSATAVGFESAAGKAKSSRAAIQFNLFGMINEEVLTELRELDLEKLTPVEAKDALTRLKNKIV